VEYGFMSSQLTRLPSDVNTLNGSADFIEIQIHDSLREQFDDVKHLAVLPDTFDGYITSHGEGETDGKRRILFSSSNDTERRQYVSNCIILYQKVIDHFDNKVRRLILHPDSISSKVPRQTQLEALARSLVEMHDRLSEHIQICIEPRGGDRQRKVLRTEFEDIQILCGHLSSLGASRRIGLCVDLAQAIIVHGDDDDNNNDKGTIKFLRQINETSGLHILEWHLSDVAINQNRVAVEVGRGRINWAKLVPLVIGFCKSILIETLGGTKVFKRSRSYLESMSVNPTNEILL
jgi:hypothetical protein